MSFRMLFLIGIYLQCISFSHGAETALVKRVLDGETLLLEDGSCIRLIGVDTPEIHDDEKLKKEAELLGKDVAEIRAMGEKSRAFVEKLVVGRKVSLEYDIFNATNGNKDIHGHTLAYVKFECKKPPQELADFFKAKELKLKWKKEKVNLNSLILQCGYGRMYKKYAFKYQDQFKQFEKEAKQNHMGLWSTDLNIEKTS